MNSRELIKQLIADNPTASNAEIARLAKTAGAKHTPRHLRKMAASVKANTKSVHDVVDTSKNSVSATNMRSETGNADGTKELSYKGTTSISSLDEAIKFFEIDTNKWRVASWTANSWDAGLHTNYQVKLRLEPLTDLSPENIEKLKQALNNAVTPMPVMHVDGSGHGIAVLSDFHIGAKVQDMMQTDDFSYDVVVSRLAQAADIINGQGYDKVSVALLGDFIETFTGLNHKNSWQQLEYGGYGANVLIIAYEILSEFLAKVNNIDELIIVSGNHDRTTIKADIDSEGGVAQLLAYMFDRADFNVKFSHSVQSSNIDGIRYLFTHNHLGLSKKDMVQTFWEYGEQGVYNVLLGGHYHSRRSKSQYAKLDGIHWDQANYRAISVAPIFTGNWYSESNGWSSTSGITILENNGDGRPNVFDYTLI